MNKKNYFTKIFTFFIALTSLLVSCNNEEDDEVNGLYHNGIFIVNEGTYGANNSSVSFYHLEGDSVINSIFETANDRPLGDVAQSIAIHNNKAFVVVNVSNKIEIVNAEDFKEIKTIENLHEPRFVAFAANKAFVTEWGNNGEVSAINLTDYTVSTIDVGNAPEGILAFNDKLYVANSGGFVTDSTVSVIDAATNQVIATIFTPHNPKALVVDKNEKIWVLCHGAVVYDPVTYEIVFESASKLVQIDPATNTVIKEIVVSENTHPSGLQINPEGDKLFVGGGFGFQGIYQVNITDNQIPATLWNDKFLYGFFVHPTTGDVFLLEAPDFTSAGKMYRYSSAGQLLGTFETDIAPSNACSYKK